MPHQHHGDHAVFVKYWKEPRGDRLGGRIRKEGEKAALEDIPHRGDQLRFRETGLPPPLGRCPVADPDPAVAAAFAEGSDICPEEPDEELARFLPDVLAGCQTGEILGGIDERLQLLLRRKR